MLVKCTLSFNCIGLFEFNFINYYILYQHTSVSRPQSKNAKFDTDSMRCWKLMLCKKLDSIIIKNDFVLNCSNYDNPCEFLSAFETSGTCPAQLAAHGLPCTCPFNPATINLPPSVFHVTHLNTAWSILATVSIGYIHIYYRVYGNRHQVVYYYLLLLFKIS